MAQLVLLALLVFITTVAGYSYAEKHLDNGKGAVAQIKGKIQAQIEMNSQPWPHLSGSFRFCGADNADPTCCLRDFALDLSKVEGLDNILTPRQINTYRCSGDCPRSIPFIGRWNNQGEKRCQPVSWEAAEVYVDTGDSGFQNIKVPELIVRACACV